MSRNFRSSLFGFNRDDVLGFVMEAKETEAENKRTIEELSARVAELESTNSELSEKYEVTFKLLCDAQKQVDDFNQREESLTHLSESIGRLYLVAQANANSIIASANENIEVSKAAVEQNMTVATAAEAELAEISRVLDEKTREYTEEIAVLKQQITDAKERIAENCAEIAERQAELENISAGVDE